MIEAYAFLVAFLVQILVMSVLHPAWFTRYARAKGEAQLPGWDRTSRERFLSLYRAANLAIAVLGQGVLAWLFNHMRSPDWDLTAVRHLLAFYTVVQITPIVLSSLIAAWVKRKALTRIPPETRRTASLQRRGLFDIVSPVTFVLAVLAYTLFAALVIYIQQHPIAGFAGYRLLFVLTLACALNAFVAYWQLYRRKKWPLETRAYRIQAVESQVRLSLYGSIVLIVFFSLNLMLKLQDLQRWVPFAASAFLVTVMLFNATMLFTLRRQAETDRLAASAAG